MPDFVALGFLVEPFVVAELDALGVAAPLAAGVVSVPGRAI